LRPVIKSRKHLVQLPFNQLSTGTAENNLLLESVAVTAKNTPREVEEGAIVKAIFVELWLQNSANDGHSVVTLSKQTDSGLGPTFAELATLDTWGNKKNILFTHEGLTSNDGVGNPVRIMYSWFKIPKTKQRMGLGDILSLSISNPSSNNLNRCGLAIYKEYT